MPFIVLISSNAFSLATRRGYTITSRRQNVQTGVETCRVHAIEKNWNRQICWQSIFGTARVYCCGFHGKEHNNQCSVILCNPRKVTSSRETNNALDSSVTTGVFNLHDNVRPHFAIPIHSLQCFRWTTWNIRHTAQIWRRVSALKDQFMATNLQVMT